MKKIESKIDILRDSIKKENDLSYNVYNKTMRIDNNGNMLNILEGFFYSFNDCPPNYDDILCSLNKTIQEDLMQYISDSWEMIIKNKKYQNYDMGPQLQKLAYLDLIKQMLIHKIKIENQRKNIKKL